MSEALFTLAGAAIGGAIGVVGTIGAARVTGRDQKRNQHDQWRQQVRRDAYILFITRASEAVRASSAAHKSVLAGRSDATELFERARAAVQLIDENEAAVLLAGPQAAVDASAEVGDSLRAWLWALDYLREREDPPPRPQTRAREEDRAVRHAESAPESIEEFAWICRRLLDKRDPDLETDNGDERNLPIRVAGL